MSKKKSILVSAAVVALAGSASARTYNGSDTLELLTERLVANCGLLGGGATYPALAGVNPEFDYIGGGSTTGGNQMRNGVQDIAPQSRKMSSGECGTTSVAAGPEGEPATSVTNPQNLPVARDGLSIMTSEANAQRCDDDLNTDADFLEATDDDFGSTIAFSGTIQTSGGPYTIQGWRDVLRIIYAGAHLGVSPGAGDPNPPVFNNVDATRVARCGSVLRRALVAQFDNILQDVAGVNGCGSVAGSCQDASGNSLPLRHAFRRDDLSGTTDTFLTILGLPAFGTSNPFPFCNGTDTQDLDPISVTCSANNPSPAAPIIDGKEGGASENATKLNDEVCDWDRVGGLVKAIRSWTFIGTNNSATSAGNRFQPTQADIYPPFNCGTGNFAIRRPPAAFASTFSCPDGAAWLFTGCLTPIAPAGSLIDHGDGTAPIEADCHCVNAWTNRAPGTPDLNPTIPGVTNDGRGWNNIVRGRHSGGATTSGLTHPTWATPANVCPVMRDERGTEIVLAQGRGRVRSTTINNQSVGSRVCKEMDATRQIGCLAKSSECAIGYAGREAVVDQPNDDEQPSPSVKDVGTLYNGGTALRVGPGSNDPTKPVRGPGPGAGEPKGYGPDRNSIFTSVGEFIPAPGIAEGYQLARKLYINSIVGFPAVLTANVGPFVATGTRLPAAGVGGLEADQLVRCVFETTTVPGTSPPVTPLARAIDEAGFLPLTPSSAVPTTTESCP